MLEIIKMIEDLGVFTGSRYWNVERKKSDYDYFFTLDTYTQVLSEIKKLKIKYEPTWYKEGIYIWIYGKQYNLFCLNQHEFKIWRLANDTMKSITNGEMNALIRERNIRVDLFETLCTFFKTNRNQDKYKEYLKEDEYSCKGCKYLEFCIKTNDMSDCCKKYKIDINGTKRNKLCMSENGKELK